MVGRLRSAVDSHSSDHVIRRPREFVRLLNPAFRAAKEGKIVVLGIQPRWAETGYGYIEFPEDVKAGKWEPVSVLGFREKPDAATAARFLAAGNFYWNAGMFFWKASVLLDALRRFLPSTAALLDSLPAFGASQFHSRMEEVFPRCDNISIDYAVLEKAAKEAGVRGIAAADFGWNDVGSWNDVYELLERDAHGNAVRGEALIESSSGSYVDSEKLVALLGVKDLIVVDTPDALLIADRARAQQVGELVKRLEKAGREDLL